MTNADFDRINTLSEKVLNSTATNNEIDEFSELVKIWNSSQEFNIVFGLDQ